MNETYTVKAGDTLYGVSNQFGVSVTELAELNGIQGSNLQIGQNSRIFKPLGRWLEIREFWRGWYK